MRRRFAVAAAALALSVALTVPAYAGTWKYVNDQWKYQKGTNKFAYNEWIKDNGKYYYIDSFSKKLTEFDIYDFRIKADRVFAVGYFCV